MAEVSDLWRQEQERRARRRVAAIVAQAYFECEGDHRERLEFLRTYAEMKHVDDPVFQEILRKVLRVSNGIHPR